mmetsp:Transcript_5305/g.9180  ORF Transcript_5305/g.9180 Transcript_5305/m.9180 type:complete len:92 (+) Transcript_5305:297-572(+)
MTANRNWNKMALCTLQSRRQAAAPAASSFSAQLLHSFCTASAQLLSSSPPVPKLVDMSLTTLTKLLASTGCLSCTASYDNDSQETTQALTG